MRRTNYAGAIAVLALVGAAAWWSRRADEAERSPPGAGDHGGRSPSRQAGMHEGDDAGHGEAHRASNEAPAATTGETKRLSAAEKTARVDKIKRDYDDIRAKAAADYSAAGAKFPGGLNAFLRQLALLEREKRADYAALLDARELEDLEYRETSAGQLVQRLLDDTPATDAQRRAVFRLQLAFEDRFALTFDLSPGALLERETARQQLQADVRRVLGDELFASWLRGEGGDFANFTRYVTQQGLSASRAIELWQVKNDFILRRLELNAQQLPVEQVRAEQRVLTLRTQARVQDILGPGASQTAGREVLGWLPPK